MRHQTEHQITASLATLSLDKLAEFAIEEKLIDCFEVAGKHVTIIQGENHFRLPDRQASTFLVGMLRGRSWYVDNSHSMNPIDSTTKEEQSPLPADAEVKKPIAGRSIEDTLQALLIFTMDAGIILGYRTNARDRLVHINIEACSSAFSYVDAVGYLLDCVQHHVRSVTETA